MGDSLFMAILFASPILGLVGLMFVWLAVRALQKTQLQVRPRRIALLCVLYAAGVLVGAVALTVLTALFLPAPGGPGQAGGLMLFVMYATLGISALLLGILLFVGARRGAMPNWLS